MQWALGVCVFSAQCDASGPEVPSECGMSGLLWASDKEPKPSGFWCPVKMVRLLCFCLGCWFKSPGGFTIWP